MSSKLNTSSITFLQQDINSSTKMYLKNIGGGQHSKKFTCYMNSFIEAPTVLQINPSKVSDEFYSEFKLNYSQVTSTTEFAKTWGRMKSNRSEEMNYEKMSRAMRYHYGCERQGRKGHLAMVKEKRLYYKWVIFLISFSNMMFVWIFCLFNCNIWLIIKFDRLISFFNGFILIVQVWRARSKLERGGGGPNEAAVQPASALQVHILYWFIAFFTGRYLFCSQYPLCRSQICLWTKE